MTDAKDEYKKDKDQPEEEIKAETKIFSDNPNKIQGAVGSASGDSGNNLTIESISGGKKINDQSFEIGDFKNETDSSEKKDENPSTISLEDQQKAAGELNRDKQNLDNKSRDGQSPAAEPNAPAENFTPLVPDENLDKDKAADAQPKQKEDNSGDSGQSAGQPPPEEQGQPAQDGADQNQIAAQMAQSRQKISNQRTQLIARRKQLSAEIGNLEKFAGNLSSTSGSTLLKAVMPWLLGKIQGAIEAAKKADGKNSIMALQLASSMLAAVLDLLIMARMAAGIIDGIIKWVNTWVLVTFAFYWWTIIGALFDIIIVLPLFMIVFFVMGGELCRVISKLRKEVKKLKEEVDKILNIQKQIQLKKQRQRQIDAVIGPMSLK